MAEHVGEARGAQGNGALRTAAGRGSPSGASAGEVAVSRGADGQPSRGGAASPGTSPGVSQASGGDERVGMLINDRYRLRKVIARGAMGTVYLADQLPLERAVAVKVLEPPADAEDNDTVRQRFLREANTLARLEHANTVRIYDFGYWGSTPFLVMEYVDGFSLRRMQQNGAIPAVRVVEIALQICAALREAHSIGLIHRDLKPANILLTRHAGALDVVKVVDFGLAKGFYGSEQDLTQNGQVLGTPMYMSPEQIRDEPCDPRSDIYSLGVVLYRSLTGETPFPKASTAEVLMANLYDRPRAFKQVRPDIDLPPVLEWVVLRCMEKRPEDRFANIAELQKALRACRRALEDPAMRGIQLTFDAGHTVMPEDVTESSYSSLHVPRQIVRPAGGPATSPTSPTSGTEPSGRRSSFRIGGIGVVPDWALLGAFVLMILGGVLAGMFVEHAVRPPEAATPTAPAAPPAAPR
jgi:serine/threonine protein kinase